MIKVTDRMSNFLDISRSPVLKHTKATLKSAGKFAREQAAPIALAGAVGLTTTLGPQAELHAQEPSRQQSSAVSFSNNNRETGTTLSSTVSSTPPTLTSADGEAYHREIERKVDKAISLGVGKQKLDFILLSNGRPVEDPQTGEYKINEEAFQRYRESFINTAKKFNSTTEFGEFLTTMFKAINSKNLRRDQADKLINLAQVNPKLALEIAGRANGSRFIDIKSQDVQKYIDSRIASKQ
jgi:hypothetical protein